jgi:DNA-binding HxlR family transcriptional regulator
MRTYGQYYPIARTSELLAERWTPIIVRNLLTGCRTFGELLDGAPGISRALLAQRLELLQEHGILTREPSSGRGGRYLLTEKGRELKAVTDAMGAWGARWLELEPQHIDPAYVLWATCKLVDLAKVPSKGLVALARWHLRHLTYEAAARSGRLQIDGARAPCKAFLACIRPSPFAGIQPAVQPSSAHQQR